MCHRSRKAYSVGLAKDLSLGDPLFKACSGAVTDDIFKANTTNLREPSQRSWLTSSTTKVTLTIGGNDADFANVLRSCVSGPESGGAYGCSQNKTLRKNVQNRLDLLAGLPTATQVRARPVHPLLDTYRAIHADAPNAKIFVGGYPPLFGTSGKNYTYGGKAPAKCVVGLATHKNVPLIYTVDFLDALWLNVQATSSTGSSRVL